MDGSYNILTGDNLLHAFAAGVFIFRISSSKL